MDSRSQNDLNYVGLIDRFAELHKLAASSRKREYWRGRIDEFVDQNAIGCETIDSARAAALLRLSNEDVREDEAWEKRSRER